MSQMARPLYVSTGKFLSEPARKYISERFNLQDVESLSETEIGRRQHPKMFGSKSVRHVLTKFVRYSIYFLLCLANVEYKFKWIVFCITNIVLQKEWKCKCKRQWKEAVCGDQAGKCRAVRNCCEGGRGFLKIEGLLHLISFTSNIIHIEFNNLIL